MKNFKAVILIFSLLLCGTSYAATAKGATEKLQLHIKPILLFSDITAIGPSAALEVPIVKHFSLGGLFNTIIGTGLGTVLILDFDVFAKGYLPLKLGEYQASVYAAIPMGFSLTLFSRSVGPSFNFGLVPGFEIFIDKEWGLFTELGFNVHVSRQAVMAGQFSIGATYLF